MLQSKQYSESWQLLDFQVFSSLPDVLRKCLEELIFLVIPEDTTASAADRHQKVRRVQARNTRSIAKVTFWIVIALIFSLSIGQLR